MGQPKRRQEPRPEVPGRIGLLTVEEEQNLARRWRTCGDRQALTRLVQAHLGFVVRIAWTFRYGGSSMDDLIQEGNIGLSLAANHFDPNRGARFATFAERCIRSCLSDCIARSYRQVRICTTSSHRKVFFGLHRARRAIERRGESVDGESLAKELGVREEDVAVMMERLATRQVSLDAPRSEHDFRSIGATLPTDDPTPEELVGEAEFKDHQRRELLAGLKVLDSRERAIIRARHLQQRLVTRVELGRRFGISHQWVEQLEARAMKKLREFFLERTSEKGSLSLTSLEI